MTQTDAAMCAPLLDAMFERVAKMLDGIPEQRLIEGFKFGAQFEDHRALQIALDENDYFVIRLTVELAGGVRQGDISIILPRSQPADSQNPSESEGEESAKADSNRMNDIAMGLPAELNMVLCKMSLELSQVDKLAVDEVIKLPHNAFPETEIVTSTGRVIGTGVLGQVDGIRALRLKREPVYAREPRRRESDLSELDLPKIESLPEKDQRKPLTCLLYTSPSPRDRG